MEIIKKIIGDGQYVIDLKEKVNFKDPKSYLKTVSAFANGDCIGYIIFGIEARSRNIIGINSVKKSYEEICNKIKMKIEPTLIPIIDIVNINKKNIILLKITPGNNTPYYYVNKESKIAYIRKEEIDIEASGEELKELIKKSQY